MTINQVVAGAAALTSSATSFTASVPGAGQTFAVASDAGYPSSGRFVVQLNRGEADEEKVLISSRSGTTFTVETRGYDGTTAQSHTNPTVNLILPATVVTALIDHVDGTGSEGADPHSTKLLNNTRHDTTARHALGTSIPVSATTPTTIEPDDTGSVGAANAVARSDHEHPAAAGAPGAILAATTTAAEGTATSFARSDHRHMVTTAAPVSVSTALAEGSSTSFAKADHSHDIGAAAVTAGDLAAGAVSAASQIANAIITLNKFASEAITPFTPTFANVVIGGGSVYGGYFKLGRLVVGFAGFILGATGNVSGAISFSAPTDVADLTGGALSGNSGAIVAGRAFDSSAGGRWSGLGIIADTGTIQSIASAGSASAWDGDDPFNWDASDVLQTFFCYVAPT